MTLTRALHIGAADDYVTKRRDAPFKQLNASTLFFSRRYTDSRYRQSN